LSSWNHSIGLWVISDITKKVWLVTFFLEESYSI
jgi:hypothetical protein